MFDDPEISRRLKFGKLFLLDAALPINKDDPMTKAAQKKLSADILKTAELIDVSALKPHPKNYKTHGPDQLAHIVKSIETHGFYRNVVLAEDSTILAGHGVIEACKQLGITKIPAVRLSIKPDSTTALKLLAGDNEIARLAMIDDRKLTEMLREVHNSVDGLMGTGFDPIMLANLVFVTRPESEIADFDAARAWVGLPAYQEEDRTLANELCLIVNFKKKEDRDKFVAEKKIKIRDKKSDRTWSTCWPYVEKHDLKSVKFKGKK